jgi:hypothetical protein
MKMTKSEKTVILNHFKALLIAQNEGFDKKETIREYKFLLRNLDLVNERQKVENEVYFQYNGIGTLKEDTFNQLYNMIQKHCNYCVRFDFDDIDFVLQDILKFKQCVPDDVKKACVGCVKYIFDLNEYYL